MKKIILILAVLGLLLCACDNRKPAQIQPPATSVPTTAPTDAPTEPTVPEQTEPVPETVPAETLPEILPQVYDWNAHSVSLTEEGTMPHREGLRIMDIPVVVTYEGEDIFYELLSATGESHFDRLFRDFEHLENGLTLAYSAVQGQIPPLCELVDVNTGKVLISDNAAQIKPLDDRFYLVIYAGTRTDDPGESFLHYTDVLFSVPAGEEMAFGGSAKVYDLQKQQYVEGLLLERPADVRVCGTTVCVERDWNVYDLYLEDGSILPGVENLYLTDTLLLQWDSSLCRVYSCNMAFIGEYENVSPISQGTVYSDRYLAMQGTDGAWGVMDMNGNAVLPAVYHSITSVTGDYFVVNQGPDENGNPCRGIVFADGTEVVPFLYREICVQESSPLLMFRLYDHQNSKSIFLPGFGGMKVGDFNTSCNVHHAYLYLGDYNNIKILLYSTFDTVMYCNPYYIYDYLIYSENKITEVLYGQTLLSGYYKRVYCSEEYLYTLQDDTWTCYKIQIH